MPSFPHIFIGIGSNGNRVVQNINIEKISKLSINPSYYLLGKFPFRQKLRDLFQKVPNDAILWVVFENKPINLEILSVLLEYLPENPLKLAYVLSPEKELIHDQKPPWAQEFDTVFYDSLWESLHDYRDASLEMAFQMATQNIGTMFTRLHYYLENQMLVNVDYADFFNMVRGNNIGILRLLSKVNFEWHWGVWDKGLINILVGENVPLSDAHRILSNFQKFLKEKDIIWGIKMEEGLNDHIEILSLLVKRW
ncbi:MAG TPA: hypothetical protein HA302_03805 [Thermococcaceae archaeon]|uniref:Uncharacterized protein n=2 Tax=Thermococcus sibiricus TaxID=172049 RepID=C6A1K0_THESM|nr:hypothetical protein [Thermococcus sibiricus]ACS89495.1 hypothetical protein TSIB_0429 [Thermococcus sibiricus MM 739]KUK16925.1 MAG: Uncharacterized protein XD54_1782 [Thermococcus sibiricus]KUK28123.1 MAG: Uncharacterized protein XD61_1332 [Thermococcus sp. 40_45]HII67133.1 hypothetical protein [Thermococcaceae archaeon]